MPQQRIRTIKAVQRNVLRYSLAGAVLIAVLTAVFIMVPTQSQLRDASVTHLGHIANSKADAIIQTVDRTKSVASLVSSRLRAQSLMHDLAAGAIDLPRFQAALAPVFMSVMNSSDEIVGITRVDTKGKIVYAVGPEVPSSAWRSGWEDDIDPIAKGLMPLLGSHYLIVSSPIVDHGGQRLGTDIIAFSMGQLLRLFSEHAGLGRTGRAFLVFGPADARSILSMTEAATLVTADAVAPPTTFKEILRANHLRANHTKPGFIHDARHTYAHIGAGKDWVLILRQDANEIFGELNKNLIFAGFGVLGLIIMGMSGLFLLLTPLTGRVEQMSGAMETQLDLMLDNIPSGLCMFDEDLRIVAFNRVYEEMYGFDEGFLKPGVTRAEAFWHLVNKNALADLEDARETIKAREAQLRQGSSSVEQTLADGRVIDVRFGNWTGGYIVAVYTDITEFKQTERILSDRRAELQAVIDAVPALINVKDIQGRYVMSNRYHQEFLGLSEQDVQGKTSEIVGAEHAAAMSKLDREVIETGQPIPFFDFELKKNGDVRQAICTKAPLKDADGRVVGVITTTIDISERRQAEERLAESEARFRQILDESPIAISIVDRDTGERLFGNPRLAAMLGADSLDDVLQIDIDQSFVDPAKFEEAREIFDREGRLDHYEAERYRLDRKTKWWSLVTWRQINFEGRRARIAWTLDITKRKAAEQQIGLQSAILRVTLDSMPSGLCVFDENMNYVTFNRQFSEVWGLQPDQVQVGTSAWETAYFLADRGDFGDAHRNRSVVERISAVRQGNLSSEVPLADGRVVYARYGEWYNGYLVGVFDDVTAQKTAQTVLEETQARLTAITENVPIMLALKGLDGRFLSANSIFAEWHETTVDNLIGKTVHDLVPKDRADEVAELERKVIESGEIVILEAESVLHKTQEGRPTIYRLMKFPVRDREGTITGLGTAMTDITEQKEAERELAHQKAILETMDQGITMFDEKLNVITANSKFMELLKFPKDRFPPGTNLSEFFRFNAERGEYGPGAVEQQVQERIDLARRFEPHHFERTRPNGMVIDIRGNPLPDRSGFVTTYSDVTQQKRTERALREAKLVAEEANRAKSSFLANMSHEIRTPLNAIVGLTGLALKTDLTEQQADYLTKVDMSSHALLSLIDDILDFSKIEAGKMEIEAVAFNLDDVMENLSTMTTARAGAKPLDIQFHIDPSVPKNLKGDPLRLGQVLINLTANAIKFTAKGKVIVNVLPVPSSTAGTAGKGMLRFEVTDTGIGMSRDQIGKLFQPFTQADISTTRQFGGTGLGLAISHSLVTMMGGEIGVDSTEGKGSTFWFTAEVTALPSDLTEDTALTHRPQPKDARSSVLERIAGLRILLVEDNEINQQVARELLNLAGMTVDIARNGKIAVDMVAETPYDAVLMDLQMPLMDGYQATQIIRADSRHKDLPIIAMTAHAMPSEREKCIAVGMNDHVTKPIDPDRLYAVLAAWAPRSGARPANPTGKAAAADSSTSAPASADALPDTIQGINLTEARTMVRENDVILRHLLGAFHAKYMDQANEIAALLTDGDLETAARAAHTLKGVSGNIRAERVYQAAKALDDQLRSGLGRPEVDACLKELSSALDEVRDSLAIALGGGNPAGEKLPPRAGE